MPDASPRQTAGTGSACSQFANIKRIVLLAGNLIDGSGGPVRRDAAVRLRDGGGFVDTKDFSDSEIVDLSGYTVMPGLVNAHVHLAMSGTGDAETRTRQLTASYGEAKGTIAANLTRHAEFGVVAVRDGGDGGGHVLRYKNELPVHGQGPVAIRAGRGWRQPGRYGKLVGGTPQYGNLSESIRKDIAESKGDHVKIVNSGLNSLKVFGKQTRPQFEADEMRVAARMAKSFGLKTMVHANGVVPVKISVEAGCDSIEHGFFMGRDNLARMADNGVFWVPTACTMKAYAEHPGIGKAEADIAKRNLDHQLDQIRLAKDYGVSIAAGTDAGSPGVHHGPAIAEEVRLLMAAGFSISEAVRCASSNGAALLGLDTPGLPVFITVAPGPPSDLPESLGRAGIIGFTVAP